MAKSKIIDKDYERFVNLCELDGIKPMPYDHWKKSVRKQDPKLSRWKNSSTSPSIWEKREKDPAYAHNMRETLGMAWGIGKPKGPGKNS